MKEKLEIITMLFICIGGVILISKSLPFRLRNLFRRERPIISNEDFYKLKDEIRNADNYLNNIVSSETCGFEKQEESMIKKENDERLIKGKLIIELMSERFNRY